LDQLRQTCICEQRRSSDAGEAYGHYNSGCKSFHTKHLSSCEQVQGIVIHVVARDQPNKVASQQSCTATLLAANAS
jgi:hypothetical protein